MSGNTTISDCLKSLGITLPSAELSACADLHVRYPPQLQPWAWQLLLIYLQLGLI